MGMEQNFKLAVKSLMSSKARAILTMLGIIIGVAAVIIITSLGNGMQTMMNEQFEKIGTNLVQVMVMGRGPGSSRTAEPEDMAELVEQYPDVLSGVTPYVSVNTSVRSGAEKFKRTQVYGVSEDFADMDAAFGEELAQGRYIKYLDVTRRSTVCVIGEYINQTAFGGDGLGKSIQIGGVPYTVVGILSGGSYALEEGGPSDYVYIPYTNAGKISDSTEVSLYMFSCAGQDSANAGKALIENKLYSIYQTADAYYVMTSAEQIQSLNMMISVLMMVLVAIAAISLLVGGIGIMNIMLVSVSERTREIGIRKSLGAKRKDIRLQFIIEAGTTSALGGLIGVVLGMVVAFVAGVVLSGMMTSMMGGSGTTFQAVPTQGAVAIAFGVSVGIGVLFGYLPANKAAKMNPIDALRYE